MFLYFLSSASLVPVISFGENELYQRHTCFNLFPNGVTWGRFILGHIPLRRPVVTVGKISLITNKIIYLFCVCVCVFSWTTNSCQTKS